MNLFFFCFSIYKSWTINENAFECKLQLKTSSNVFFVYKKACNQVFQRKKTIFWKPSLVSSQHTDWSLKENDQTEHKKREKEKRERRREKERIPRDKIFVKTQFIMYIYQILKHFAKTKCTLYTHIRKIWFVFFLFHYYKYTGL